MQLQQKIDGSSCQDPIQSDINRGRDSSHLPQLQGPVSHRVPQHQAVLQSSASPGAQYLMGIDADEESIQKALKERGKGASTPGHTWRLGGTRQ